MYLWTEESISRLISSYGDNKCLYNTLSPDYHNRTKRKLVLERLANEFNTTGKEVAKKLKYLRNQYVEEVRKERKIKRGMGADTIYCSKWKYFASLSFLMPYLNFSKLTASNVQMLAELPEAEAITNDSSSNESGHFMNRLNSSGSTMSDGEHSSLCSPDTVEPDYRHIDVKSLSGMKRKSEKNQPESVVAALTANDDFVNKSDDTGDREVSFGSYVAARLKRIRSSKIKHQVEKMIMDAIYDGEMHDGAE